MLPLYWTFSSTEIYTVLSSPVVSVFGVSGSDWKKRLGHLRVNLAMTVKIDTNVTSKHQARLAPMMVRHAHVCGPLHTHLWLSPTLGPSPAGLGLENPVSLHTPATR